MEKLNKSAGQSMDIVAANIAKLKELFPEILTENKIDFKTLQTLLGEEVETDDERYSFNWHGKAQARQLAQTTSTGTLRPCKEDSVDWDVTQNLFIEGDNLEVLKLLQKSYHKQVKMIYIDPPYNTGSDFVYPDNFHDNIQNYLELTGQIEGGKKISPNTEASGRYHTDWLNMMYPRLKLARNLLRDDGVIVIHIDEHEQENLLFMLNDIFGEDNNLGTIVWDKKNPKGDAKGIAYQHESILVFARNRLELVLSHELVRKKANAESMVEQASALWAKKGTYGFPLDLANVIDKYRLDKNNFKDAMVEFDREKIEELYAGWVSQQDVLSGGEAAYNKLDDNGEVYRLVHMGWPNKKKAPDEYFIPLIHPVTGKACPVPDRGWRNPPETMKKYLDSGEIVFGANESVQPQRKYLLKENMSENIPSILRYGGSDDALFKELKLVFENPKPYRFSADLVSYFTHGESEIVLDFFAGSGTSGHAVLEANKRDKKSRRFILVQLPEPVEGTTQTIADICKKRIKGISSKYESLDGKNGFKAFKLDSSNLKPWDADFDSLAQDLAEATEVVKAERSAEDVLFEILLKYGLDLTLPIATHVLEGKTVYEVGAGALVVCLDSGITEAVAEAIGKLKEMLEPEVMRVVFKDSGFANDAAKVNAVQVLKQFGIDDVKSI
jgi:adenine-specific DNA-methyltransferase